VVLETAEDNDWLPKILEFSRLNREMDGRNRLGGCVEDEVACDLCKEGRAGVLSPVVS